MISLAASTHSWIFVLIATLFGYVSGQIPPLQLLSTVSHRYGLPTLSSPRLPNIFHQTVPYIPSTYSIQSAPSLPPLEEDYYDFVIVGGGSAGSVVAARLSEVRNYSVLLLETGPQAPSPSNAYATNSLMGSCLNWDIVMDRESGYARELIDQRMAFPRGLCGGGSSTSSYTEYSRGHTDDYDSWPGWTSSEVDPYFKKLEKLVSRKHQENAATRSYYGDKGPFLLDSYRNMNPFLPQYYEAVRQAGFPFNDDFRWNNLTGFGEALASTQAGKLIDTSLVYLVPALGRPNLRILYNVEVNRIVFDGNVAVGVSFQMNGVQSLVKVRREVIVSSGAFGTTQLLWQSGVGPAAELQAIGVEKVVADLPVGKYFQDQPAYFGCVYAVDATKTNLSLVSHYSSRTGSGPPCGPGFCNVQGFLVSSKSPGSQATGDIPDARVRVVLVPRGDVVTVSNMLKQQRFPGAVVSYLTQQVLEKDLIFHVVSTLKPKSRGRVYLNKLNDLPRVEAGFYRDPDDMEVMKKTVDLLRNILNTDAMKQVDAKELRLPLDLCKDLAFPSIAYDECAIRSIGTSLFSSTSTTKMYGGSVDGRLCLTGVRKVRLVDASVAPCTVRSPFTALTLMVGERGSDFIKQDNPV